MKKVVIILGVVIVIMVAVLLLAGSAEAPENDQNEDTSPVATFVCPSGDDITITYQGEFRESATLAVRGETYELEQVRTASGIRYANQDETVVYSEHQGEASVQVDNVMIYEGCTMAGDVDSSKADGATSATLACPDGEELTIAYSGESNENATLFLPDATYELTQARSGSGIRYENENEGVEYREAGGEARVTVNGEVMYENCEVNRDTEDATDDTAAVDLPDNQLQASKWQWVETRYDAEATVVPNKPTEFILTFDETGRFSALTDCNNITGNYEVNVNNGNLDFSQLAMTKMACPGGTQESDFAEMLGDANAFIIGADGSLVLSLESPEGSMVFQPTE